jgi:hypothetical protein
MNKIWKIMDDFPIENSTWLPYYAGNDFVTADKDDVKVSIYKADGKILAFCNPISIDFKEEVEITSSFKNITDALTGEKLSDNGKYKTEMCGFGCRIFVIEE